MKLRQKVLALSLSVAMVALMSGNVSAASINKEVCEQLTSNIQHAYEWSHVNLSVTRLQGITALNSAIETYSSLRGYFSCGKFALEILNEMEKKDK